jgi:hypothetical protein
MRSLMINHRRNRCPGLCRRRPPPDYAAARSATAPGGNDTACDGWAPAGLGSESFSELQLAS